MKQNIFKSNFYTYEYTSLNTLLNRISIKITFLQFFSGHQYQAKCYVCKKKVPKHCGWTTQGTWLRNTQLITDSLILIRVCILKYDKHSSYIFLLHYNFRSKSHFPNSTSKNAQRIINDVLEQIIYPQNEQFQ